MRNLWHEARSVIHAIDEARGIWACLRRRIVAARWRAARRKWIEATGEWSG
jgi:hypothetical protein